MSEDVRRLSASQLRLRVRHPFFASLALFAKIQVTERVGTAATDGRDIYFNPMFLQGLASAELDGVLLHEVLHAALLHVTRRGTREPRRWNHAADIVVNGMVRAQKLELPPGAVERPEWADYSVEEVYDLLQKHAIEPPPELLLDLDDGTDAGLGEAGALGEVRTAALEAHWRHARAQAHVIARQAARMQGASPGDESREWALVDEPQVDWRAELWRYVVQTPVDFAGFDRRFVYRGLYLDAMAGETLDVWVAIDTSGSVDAEELGEFVAELHGILRAYPHIHCRLYYADADLHGPFLLSGDELLPEARGGGGTSFVPFFDALSACSHGDTPDVCVYLTDGYGDFPDSAAEVPTLWLVTAGGLASEAFPFGKVVRLLVA